jgi:STAS domain
MSFPLPPCHTGGAGEEYESAPPTPSPARHSPLQEGATATTGCPECDREQARGAAVVCLAARLAPADIPALCERAEPAMRRGSRVVVCARAVSKADGVAVDALARLRLRAGRRGTTLELRHASPELLDLIDWMGLGAELAPAVSRRGGAAARRAGRTGRCRGRT